jgi:tRNA threonylcarbamoyladenosine biosynthesis protein TsaE
MKITYVLSEIDSIATRIIECSKSNILLFYGDMGVGKTTLITSLAKQLGVSETVSSPTFSIVNEYRTLEDKVLYHFEFYRIHQEEEVLDIGFEEYIMQGDWIFIEWPERITSFIPENSQNVQISIDKTGQRVLIMK